MSGAVTLPGTLPGLLRRGAYVLSSWDGRKGVIFSADDCSAWVAVMTGHSGDFARYHHNHLHLDLTDPAGCDIAARWLAERVGLTVGVTAPEWGRHSIYTDGPARFYWGLGGAHGKPFHDHDGIYWRTDYNPVRVPGISTLTNPAEALAAACLALTPTPKE